eukprot:4455469-Amphidinium_carterae.1
MFVTHLKTLLQETRREHIPWALSPLLWVLVLVEGVASRADDATFIGILSERTLGQKRQIMQQCQHKAILYQTCRD